MDKYTAHEDDIYDAIRSLPLPISCDDDDRDEHEREAIIDGAEAADEPQSVAIAHQKRESIASFRTCEVVC
jgi:hypothetical protein